MIRGKMNKTNRPPHNGDPADWESNTIIFLMDSAEICQKEWKQHMYSYGHTD